MIEKSLIVNYTDNLSTSEKLHLVFNKAIEKNYSVVIWSLPKKDEFSLLIDTSDHQTKGKVELETSKPGFIVSPFLNSDGEETVFLNADILFNPSSNAFKIDKDLPPAKLAEIEDFIGSIAKGASRNGHYLGKTFQEHEPNFTAFVEEGIKQINKGTFEKFVPSRTTEISLTPEFDLVEKLLELREAYENAFCYLLSTPATGTWMAATPELLIEVSEQKKFKTVALAGTQKLEHESHLGNIAWTQKEIEEQAMVGRYIINCFKKIRLREFAEKGPKTVKAGNLAHLKTEYSVDMEETSFPLLGSVMLDLLHPTSAVCGMPLEPSLKFISEHEGYDRQLFAGYLGPVNVENNTNIFVNLRCIQIFGNKGVLYAGAGVTDDSIPEKEFLETEMKFKTLLNILG